MDPSQEIEVEVDGADYVHDKRKALLAMNFSWEDIDSAISFLGDEASMRDILEFIVTAQTAGSSVQKETQEFAHMNSTEMTMESTVDKENALLEMGYSREEVSNAIRILGANVSILDLADSIFAKQIAEASPQDYMSAQDASLEAKMEMLQNVAVSALL